MFLLVYLNLKESSAHYLTPLMHATVSNIEVFTQVWCIFVTISRMAGENRAKVPGERYITVTTTVTQLYISLYFHR